MYPDFRWRCRVLSPAIAQWPSVWKSREKKALALFITDIYKCPKGNNSQPAPAPGQTAYPNHLLGQHVDKRIKNTFLAKYIHGPKAAAGQQLWPAFCPPHVSLVFSSFEWKIELLAALCSTQLKVGQQRLTLNCLAAHCWHQIVKVAQNQDRTSYCFILFCSVLLCFA